ncbi:MAG: oxidoreductase [Planctomycetes bacterium]|nr:oxidoreductase [Planctomycetota bacterium]
MTFASIPWLELAVAAPLAGAVARVRDPRAAARWCLALSGAGLVCAVIACATADDPGTAGPLARLFGRPVFVLDALSAPLVPLVALLHFLTALATGRTKLARVSFAWLLAGQAVRVGTFACAAPGDLAVFLLLGVVPPYFDLRRRGRATRAYAVHMGVFAALLLGGLGASGTLAAALLMGAVLVRSGTVPAHVWVTDLFENGSFGAALLAVTPLVGMYAAVRLVLPAAPPAWVLEGIGLASLVTALYAAGLAVVQTDARRFFAYLFLGHAALVLVGMELHTAISLTGALALWGSVAVSLAGFGLTLRALEARFGRLELTEYRGLYAASPALAVCFLLTGLACVGFPGTSGFVATELLVDGVVGASPVVGFGVVLAGALNGIAIMRAYLLQFTGARYVPGVALGMTSRERAAVLALALPIFGVGLFPQPYIASRHHAAKSVLTGRGPETPAGTPDPVGIRPPQGSHRAPRPKRDRRRAERHRRSGPSTSTPGGT